MLREQKQQIRTSPNGRKTFSARPEASGIPGVGEGEVLFRRLKSRVKQPLLLILIAIRRCKSKAEQTPSFVLPAVMSLRGRGRFAQEFRLLKKPPLSPL